MCVYMFECTNRLHEQPITNQHQHHPVHTPSPPFIHFQIQTNTPRNHAMAPVNHCIALHHQADSSTLHEHNTGETSPNPTGERVEIFGFATLQNLQPQKNRTIYPTPNIFSYKIRPPRLLVQNQRPPDFSYKISDPPKKFRPPVRLNEASLSIQFTYNYISMQYHDQHRTCTFQKWDWEDFSRHTLN